jgi:hypothetical protein
MPLVLEGEWSHNMCSACSVCLRPGRWSDMRSQECAATGELPI